VTQGPIEFHEDLDVTSMLNLGALYLPNVPGLEVHLDLDPRSGKGKSVSLHLGMTIAEVQVFAAAANEDLWANMRDAIATGLREQKVDCSVELGRFGTEIHAVMPTVDLDGNVHVQPVRFIGVRGPRWLVRVVVSGDGALLNSNIARDGELDIDDVVTQLVVNRGDAPLPPGERLVLQSPDTPDDMGSQTLLSENANQFKFGAFHIQL
jgi:hypothetical protein